MLMKMAIKHGWRSLLSRTVHIEMEVTELVCACVSGFYTFYPSMSGKRITEKRTQKM